MKSIDKKFISLLIMLVALSMSACASKLKIKSMLPGEIPVTYQSGKSVAVLVQAGLEPVGMDNPAEETSQRIATAVKQTIKTSRVFSKVVERNQADYLLNISMISLDYDEKVFRNMRASIEMAWALIDLNNHRVIIRRTINSSHRIEFDWHQFITTRRRKAMEGAIQSNIHQGLQVMGGLQN